MELTAVPEAQCFSRRDLLRPIATSEWIGGPGNVFCRQEFEVDDRPNQGTLNVLADPHSYAITHWQSLPSKYPYDNWLVGGSFLKYRVFINGVLAAVGPFRSIKDGVPALMQHDVSPLLRPGTNVLAVVSRGEARGFALSLELGFGTERRTIRSSSTWRQRDANSVFRPVCWECPAIDQFSKGGPSPGEYPEHLDGLAYPQGWKDAGFDDSDWSPAKSSGLAVDECEISQTPPYALTRCQPVSIVELSPGNYLADFGRAVFGGIELTGPATGGAVELRLAEELLPDGHARFQLRTENCFQEIWNFAPDSEPLSHFGTRMFRYAEVSGWRGTFDANRISAVALGMPFDESRSDFGCADERLEQVWNLCKTTIATTTADVFTDCLTRERLAYEADAYVTMLTQFNVEGSTATARRTLDYLVNHPSWPCEWWQFFIPLFKEYLLHSGDFDFVDGHYNFLSQQTTFHHLMVDGLIREFPRETIVDWPESERDGYEFGNGNAVPNAFAHWDILELAELADFLGREAEADQFRDQAALLKEGFNCQLFNPETGLYVDSLGSSHSSFHANLYALRFGLVPDERRSGCLEFVKRRGMAGSVFTAQFLLETLFINDEADLAIGLMTSNGRRSWLEMIRQGAVATTESWLDRPKPNLSWAHPWGSSPANVIARHLFGIRPTSPGWKTFEFDPRPGSLERGHLHITTPRGPIRASFSNHDGILNPVLQTSFAKH